MKPLFNQDQNHLSTSQKIKLVAICFLLNIVVKILSVLIISFLKVAGYSFVLDLFLENKKMTDHYSATVSVLLLVIIYPLMEELGFRGWFSKNKWKLSVSITMFTFYFIHILLFYVIQNEFLNGKIAIYTINVLVLCFIFFISLKHYLKIKDWIEIHRKELSIISILTFSSIHAFNYNIDFSNKNHLIAIIFILLPYPIYAFLFLYVRIKAGLGWSYLLHVMGNSFVLIPVLIGEKI